MVVLEFIEGTKKIILKKIKLMNKWNIYNIFLLLSSTLLLSNCNDHSSSVQRFDDKPTEGTIYISVDETFKPVIDSQIQVFESQYPKAHIIATYKSEADCIKDLDNDSVRMVIVTRSPIQKEFDFYKKKLGFSLRSDRLAYDAVAVAMNKAAKDTMLTVNDIRELLAGTSKLNYKIVLDGLNATSTVRFALDSILRGKPFGKNVQAAKNSQAVIDYVASDPNSIGLLGVNWVGKKEDDNQLSFSDKIRLAAIRCDLCENQPYVYPFQGNIALGRYPFIRGLFYILKENGSGLGSGFLNFMNYERGQLIFKRAYLLPAQMRFDVRNMSIETK